MKRLSEKILTFFSFLYPYSLYEWITRKKDIIRTSWLKNNFKSMGKGVTIRKIGLLKGLMCISIGDKTRFGNDLYLTAWPEKSSLNLPTEIIIGSNCSFGAYNHITAINKIVIGDNVLTGKLVTITDNSHGATDYESLKLEPLQRPVISKGPVIIGNNVWICDKATILPDVVIGEGAVIAANAVVCEDVPPYSVVAGVPAKIVKRINKLT